MSIWVYILKCSDDSYNVGITAGLDVRVWQHQSGAVESYTSTRRPVTLVWANEFGTRKEAFDFERRIKGWSRAKKEALIRNDWETIHRLAKGRERPSTAGAKEPAPSAQDDRGESERE